MTSPKTAQDLWLERLLNGTWTPERLVPEMQAAARSAAESINSMKMLIEASATSGS
jgi:hypothetical protein